MFLFWLDVVVQSVSELLWYLQVSPPPNISSAENTAKSGQSAPRPSLPPEITVIKSRSPSLFALIIGINKYKDPAVPDLRAAVQDADAVHKFLTSKAGAAEDRIVNLRDEEATREAMVNAIQNLAYNPAISAEDPILIFYAGHGSEAPPPTNWKTSNENNMIQMLIPHDFTLKGSNDHEGQGVFDVTLSKLLDDIARNKSDNITVIFDSCHSGSGTRTDPRDSTFAVRAIELPRDYSIPANIFGPEERASSVAAGYETTGWKSHVLLAACKQGQTAKERQGHGAFTSALLGLLEEGPDQLSYADIIRNLPDLPFQNPQCQGAHQTRILFNSKVPSPYRNLYRVRAASDHPGKYILEAGEAHGVTNTAEFAVYANKNMTSLVGSIVASDTDLFNSRCSVIGGSSFSLSQPAYAVQTRVGEGQDIRLFIEANDAFLDLFRRLGEEMQRTNPGHRSFFLVNNANENPALALSTRDSLVQFHVMDETCRKYGLTRMPFDDIRVDESEYLFSILSSAADFYWNLRHSNRTNGALTQMIIVECLKLVRSGKYTDELDPIHIPEPGGQNLNVGGTIMIDIDANDMYGYQITNTSAVPLYVALFYFDVSDLSIVPYYLPGMAAKGQVDFSVPTKRSLTIGFGDGGMPPCTYFLRKNQSVDVGFLKLYLSTEFIDYSSIAQVSPFKENRGSYQHSRPKKRKFWDALTITMIQKRGMGSHPGFGEDRGGDFGAGFGAGSV